MSKESFPLDFMKVTPSDINLLRDISIRTFKDTYADFNTVEDMQQHEETVFSPDRLLSEIQDVRVSYFFAKVDAVTVGYIRLNSAGMQTDLNDPLSLELERIYVLKEYQGNGYGASLLDYSFLKAKEAKSNYLWLGVWQKNEKALRFYIRNGFSIFGTHDFMLGNDPQADWLMRKSCL